MFRFRYDPIWLLIIGVPFLIWGLLADPSNRKSYLFWLAAFGAFIFLRLLFWSFRRLHGAPVPDSAVREMLDRCIRNNQNQEWILVRFQPRISVEEARRKVGSERYSEEDRLRGFMTKCSFAAPSRPDIAIFYSPQKGFLLARSEMIRKLERKYGRWILDTWYSLGGAMTKMGMSTCDLDGGQLFMHGQHVGSVPDED